MADITFIRDEAELRELMGTAHERARRKERPVLHAHDRSWIAAAPFCMIATAGADGRCDVSPKGDAPGFTAVLDDRTLAIPDRPGNKRFDGFGNILANPHIGLIFVVPGRTETLRVNGRARLVRDAPFMDEMVVRGKRPALALLVDVEQVYYHCGKAFIRSNLWHPESWPAEDALPTLGQIMTDQLNLPSTADELDAYYAVAYEESLY